MLVSLSRLQRSGLELEQKQLIKCMFKDELKEWPVNSVICCTVVMLSLTYSHLWECLMDFTHSGGMKVIWALWDGPFSCRPCFMGSWEKLNTGLFEDCLTICKWLVDVLHMESMALKGVTIHLFYCGLCILAVSHTHYCNPKGAEPWKMRKPDND